MRRVSKKRQVALRVYARERKAFLTDNPTCARCEQAPSTEVHHRAGRGHLLNETDLWMALCHPCHLYITEHPAEAYEHGWSVRRVGGAA